VDARPREIMFLDAGGVRDWLDEIELADEQLYDTIIARLERVENGNFGDWKPNLLDGVSELRFLMTGPGYRIYFGQHDDIVVLLRVGTKKTQDVDLKIAVKLWIEYNQNG
jgi:putative addiction module killer protein